jgi:hypothetical protein
MKTIKIKFASKQPTEFTNNCQRASCSTFRLQNGIINLDTGLRSILSGTAKEYLNYPLFGAKALCFLS